MKLGCVMPGESPQVFGDAIRRLAAAATYLYQDGPRYWYATQPTVTKLADDRALQLERDPDAVHTELKQRLEVDLGFKPRDEKRRGDFARVHLLPRDGGEVPDELETRLVVLDIDHSYTRGQGMNPAEAAAQAILASRGSAPRLNRNTLAFLAADKVRLQDLDEALRCYLAWRSILDEKEELNLDPHQVRQAETQRAAADSAVAARLPESYQWALVPTQKDPKALVEWRASRLGGGDPLAVRASKKLRTDELLITNLGGTLVRKALDEIPLWRGDHVPVRTLVEDFAQQIYLPRLAGPPVLTGALPRRDRAVDLANGHLRLRRVFRRELGALPRLARWGAGPSSSGQPRPDREAGHSRTAAGRRHSRAPAGRRTGSFRYPERRSRYNPRRSLPACPGPESPLSRLGAPRPSARGP